MNPVKEAKTPLVLHLTGGLGNELFQIAAALHSSESKSISVEWILGKPRVNESNFPQLECFVLPAGICLLGRTQDSWLAGKTLGYLLRSSINPKGIERHLLFQKIAKLLGSFVLLVKFGRFRVITTGNNVGYFPLNVDDKKRHLVGYFQSFKYSDSNSVMATLKNLKAKNFENYKGFEDLAKLEEPLVVHVRLADYRQEDRFGILELQYYHDSVTELWTTGKYKKIWLFSDEPNNALDRIPTDLQSYVRSFGDVENCIVKTLEVMRLGKGYVIANSSFGWWGARLSKTENPVVVAPDPWFRSLSEPRDLIPPSWVRKRGWSVEK